MNILVTGATKGIGRSIAARLFDVGDLYVTGRNKELLLSIPAKAYCLCDLSNDISQLENFIIENEIDVLINNAGHYVYGGVEGMSDADIQNIFRTNLLSPIKLIRAAVPHMKEKNWGRIINIGSISGVMGEANASLYSSSKAGLIGLTKALALELAQYNITVNTINPGWVDTNMGLNSIEGSDFTKEEIIDTIPQKRFVSPEEISAMVAYLISNEARGVTGQGINICAGLSAGI